jgi:ATP-dependent DNA helicase RecG
MMTERQNDFRTERFSLRLGAFAVKKSSAKAAQAVSGVVMEPEDLMKGNYIAIHRNKLLAEAFYLRGDIEKFGTGFYRIQMALKEFPEVQFSLETLYGFTQSGLRTSMQDAMQVTPHVTPQDTPHVTPHVKDMIISIKDVMTREEIQTRLNLKNRKYFRIQYLQPGLESGVIAMTIPDKPRSKSQKYRLTEKGKKLRDELLADKNDENYNS